MKSHLIYIPVGLILLIFFLLVGTPFEFLDPSCHVLATYTLIFLILAFIIFLYRQTRHIVNLIIKRITILLISLVFAPYIFVGIWTMIITPSPKPPMWQDISVYTNTNGDRVISQWRETSGSIYDYRKRKIIGDFGKFRISYDYYDKNMHGIWNKFDLEDNKTTVVNFDNIAK